MAGELCGQRPVRWGPERHFGQQQAVKWLLAGDGPGEQGSDCQAEELGLTGGMEESPRGVRGAMTDAGTSSHGPDGRLGGCCNTASSCSASFLQAHTPSHPVSHRLCETRNGHWERAVWGRVVRWWKRDTPSFLLVTGSNFQHIFQALVMPEVLSTQGK